jgi:hypothetical protein
LIRAAVLLGLFDEALGSLDVPLASFTADGAYDGRPVYEAVLDAPVRRR